MAMNVENTYNSMLDPGIANHAEIKAWVLESGTK